MWNVKNNQVQYRGLKYINDKFFGYLLFLSLIDDKLTKLYK